VHAFRRLWLCTWVALLSVGCSDQGSPAGDRSGGGDRLMAEGPLAVADAFRPGVPILVGEQFLFTEGPVWDAQAGRLLFSDIDANTIYQLTLPDTATVFRKPSSNANGLALDRQGLLLAAEHGSRRVTRRMADGTIKTVAQSYEGKRLNSPNDLVVRSDGTIYFTDPTFGLGSATSELGFMGLYRVDPQGGLTLEAKIDGSPNGVDLSPDEKTLYVTVTFKDQLLAFDVASGGGTSNQRVVAQVSQPDGMAVARDGTLYVASNDAKKPAVVVLSAGGIRLGAMPIGQGPTNCGLGGPDGKTLFITARKALYTLTVP
jgi:gluconolactonase